MKNIKVLVIVGAIALNTACSLVDTNQAIDSERMNTELEADEAQAYSEIINSIDVQSVEAREAILKDSTGEEYQGVEFILLFSLKKAYNEALIQNIGVSLKFDEAISNHIGVTETGIVYGLERVGESTGTMQYRVPFIVGGTEVDISSMKEIAKIDGSVEIYLNDTLARSIKINH